MDESTLVTEQVVVEGKRYFEDYLDPSVQIAYKDRADIEALYLPNSHEAGDYLSEILGRNVRAPIQYPYPEEIATAGAKEVIRRIPVIEEDPSLCQAERTHFMYQNLVLAESLFRYPGSITNPDQKFSNEIIAECDLAYINAIFAYAKYAPPLYEHFLYRHAYAIVETLFGEKAKDVNPIYAPRAEQALVHALIQEGKLREAQAIVKSSSTAYLPFLKSIQRNLDIERSIGKISPRAAWVLGYASVDNNPLFVYKMIENTLVYHPNLSTAVNDSLVALAKVALSKIKLGFKIHVPDFSDALYLISLDEEAKRFRQE
jgi:hypothetical protein